MTAEMISTAIGLLDDDPECAIGTLAAPIESEDELADPNVVKVVVDERWRALYFSRAVIPHVRGATRPLHESPSPHMAHLGIYAYRRDSLLRYAAMPPHPLEQAEKLEQLRALACGFTIKVALTASRMHKVDTPEDFALFCRFLEQRANSGSRP